MDVLVLSGLVMLFLFFVFMFFSFYVIMMDECWIFEYSFGYYIGNSFDLVLVFDWMSVMFLCLVLLISSCVFFYSIEYMSGDFNIIRFCFLVLLFVLSMGIVILSSNLLTILVGWDGLGLVSYVLVIYYQNVRSLNAGMLTVLSNRVGDVGLLLGIVWMFGFGNWNYVIFVNLLDDYNVGLIGIFILVAAITSSAQMPFSAWLPAAMAAPTPVSALVHSSTLVTAGIYLLIRFGIYYSYYFFSWLLLLISLITLFLAGFCALFEMDMSSVVALSTLSQLGFMMMILGFGGWWISYFHLLTHALFKSLLFLCVGYMIHSYNNEQDFRGVGGVVGSPIVVTGVNLSLFALMGFPFLSGFYSSDLIIEFFVFFGGGVFFFFFMCLGLILTVLYSLRLGYLMIWGCGIYNVGLSVMVGGMMEYSIIVLSLFSVTFGGLLSWLLFSVPSIIFVSFYVMLIGVFFLFVGFVVMWMFFFDFWLIVSKMTVLDFGGSMWFMINLSGNCLCKVLDEVYSDFEVGWSEVVGGWGVQSFISLFVLIIELLWNNVFMLYLFSLVVWLFLLFILF